MQIYLLRNPVIYPMSKREVWVKICPKCKSLDVTSRGAISRQALSPDWICRNCGYQAGTFPEFRLEDAEKIALREDESKRRLVPSRMPFFADTHRKPSDMENAYSRLIKAAAIIIVLWALLR